MVQRTSLWQHIGFHYASLVKTFAPGFFYLPLVFLYPSITSVALCFVGGIAGALWYVALTSLDDAKRLKEAFSGYLEPFSECDFHQFQLSDYIETGSPCQLEEEAKIAGTHVVGMTFRFRISNDIKIYVVKKGKSPVVPSQLAAYETILQFTPSFIFVRDEPRLINPVGRYFLYHEVGHASPVTGSSRWTSRLGWKSFVPPVLWMMVSLRLDLISFAAFTIYVLLLLVVYPRYKYWLSQARVHEEISADRFALRCLSAESLRFLAAHFDEGAPVPRDSSLEDSFNYVRRAVLLDDLQQAQETGVFTDPISYITSKPINYFLLAFSILLPAIGFLVREPSLFLLCVNVFLCGLPLAILISSLLGTKALEYWINTRLSVKTGQ